MLRRGILVVCLAVIGWAAPAAQAAITPQVIGGSPQTPGAFPFMAALVDPRAPTDYDGMFCGGTLVAPMLVLTAAHCTRTWSGSPLAARHVVVVLGRSDLTSSEGERIAVTAIYRDPEFDSDTLLHDAALLQLARPAIEEPVALITPEEEALVAPTLPATVLGWGNMVAVGRGVYPAALRGATVPIIDDATCGSRALYGDEFLPLTMLCAGVVAGGVDSCDGDSGGPLLVAGDGGWREAGIVSWGGSVCAAPNRPGVYTRVSAERPWILAAFTPQPPVLTAVDLRDGRLEVGFGSRPGAVATDAFTVDVVGRDPLTVPGDAGSITLEGLPRDTDLTVTVTASNATYGTSAIAFLMTRIVGAPRPLARPLVHGHRLGGTFTCVSGTWVGILPLAFAYRWLVDGHTYAHRRTIVVRSRLAGRRLVCEVTGRNADGRFAVRSATTRAPRR